MVSETYKKMAGTAAVFIADNYNKASPVERDGLVWSAEELHLADLPSVQQIKPELANVIALEGLEEYDPPQNGDVRTVTSMGLNFMYFEKIQGWIQINLSTITSA